MELGELGRCLYVTSSGRRNYWSHRRAGEPLRPHYKARIGSLRASSVMHMC